MKNLRRILKMKNLRRILYNRYKESIDNYYIKMIN